MCVQLFISYLIPVAVVVYLWLESKSQSYEDLDSKVMYLQDQLVSYSGTHKPKSQSYEDLESKAMYLQDQLVSYSGTYKHHIYEYYWRNFQGRDTVNDHMFTLAYTDPIVRTPHICESLRLARDQIERLLPIFNDALIWCWLFTNNSNYFLSVENASKYDFSAKWATSSLRSRYNVPFCPTQ